MKYDLTLKELFQQMPQQLFNILIGRQPKEVLNVEYPVIRKRCPDLVSRLEDGSIYHLELQSDNDDSMPMRMLEYFFLIKQHYKQPIIQQVLYVGRDKMNMSNHIIEEKIQFYYQLIDIRDINCEPLLQSPLLEDNLLAVLCKVEKKVETIQIILQRIAQLHTNARRDALEKLQILVNLRSVKFQRTFNQEVKNMPISVDMRNTVWYQEVFSEGERKGKVEGERKGRVEGERKGKLAGQRIILQHLLEKRFGNLPNWVYEQIEQAQSDQLEQWSLQILEVDKLEELFIQSL